MMRDAHRDCPRLRVTIVSILKALNGNYLIPNAELSLGSWRSVSNVTTCSTRLPYKTLKGQRNKGVALAFAGIPRVDQGLSLLYYASPHRKICSVYDPAGGIEF